jgi:hypothetical protein
VEKYTILRTGSKVGVLKLAFDPYFQESPAHELGSMVENFHKSFPVAGA